MIIDQQISYMINKVTIKFVDHVWYLLINDQWSTVDHRLWSLIMLWSTVDHKLWSLIIAMINCWSYAMIIDHCHDQLLIIRYDHWSLPWETVDHTWSTLINASYRDHYCCPMHEIWSANASRSLHLVHFVKQRTVHS